MSRRLNPWQIDGLRAGQKVICEVTAPEPGGYTVTLREKAMPGFLPTQACLRTGQIVEAEFVCVHNYRILLSARFTSNPDPDLEQGHGGARVPIRPIPPSDSTGVSLPLPKPENEKS